MNETIRRLETQIAGLIDQQEAALASAEAEGCSAEDRARHLANWDSLQTQIATARESLTRATASVSNRAQLNAGRGEPATPAIVQLHNPHAAVSAPALPAGTRRRANLKAFKGTDANERAYRAGLFVAGALLGHSPSRQRYAEMYGHGDLNATTLSTSSNTGAAYFVPDVMDMEIERLSEEYGVIRRLAKKRTMTSDTWSGPRWTGALTTYFVGEGQAPTAQTEQTYDLISLVAKNLAAYGKMSRNLSEDAIIDLGDEWTMYAAISFAQKEDDCAINGTGASAYGGIHGLLPKIILSANSAGLVTATGHTTLGALTLADFWSVVGKVPNYPGIDPVWLCHKEVYAASMGPLQTAAGGVTAQDIANGGIPKFLNYPVEYVNVMPRAASVTTGVTGILLADLAMSTAFGDRRQRTFEVGMINDDFIKQLITLLSTERFDINCHTIVDPVDSTKPGPVIGLKLG